MEQQYTNLKKLKEKLQKGDHIKIGLKANVDQKIVTRFLNGKEKVSTERATAIIDASIEIITERRELEKANSKKIAKALTL